MFGCVPAYIHTHDVPFLNTCQLLVLEGKGKCWRRGRRFGALRGKWVSVLVTQQGGGQAHAHRTSTTRQKGRGGCETARDLHTTAGSESAQDLRKPARALSGSSPGAIFFFENSGFTSNPSVPNRFRPPLSRRSIEQEMARRPGQGVETRGGWKTTLQHIVVGPPAAAAPPPNGGSADGGGGKSAPHVPLKVMVVTSPTEDLGRFAFMLCLLRYGVAWKRGALVFLETQAVLRPLCEQLEHGSHYILLCTTHRLSQLASLTYRRAIQHLPPLQASRRIEADRERIPPPTRPYIHPSTRPPPLLSSPLLSPLREKRCLDFFRICCSSPTTAPPRPSSPSGSGEARWTGEPGSPPRSSAACTRSPISRWC